MKTKHKLQPRKDFIGRQDKIQEVMHALLETRAWIVSIDGLGGVGKTALALEVAYRVKDLDLYSGIAWVTAKESWLTPTGIELKSRSFGSENDLLREILRVSNIRIMADSDEMRARAKALLSDPQAPYLIIIDNLDTVHDPKVFEFLRSLREIEGGGETKALLTSRTSTSEGAYIVKLEGMSEDTAVELIRLEAEKRGLESLRGAPLELLVEIAQKCAGLPLTIQWTIARMAQTGYSVSEVLTELGRSEGDVLSFVFDLALSKLSVNAEELLFATPAFASTIPRLALREITGFSESKLRSALSELHQYYLMSESREGSSRYDLLPATRMLVRAIWDETPNFGQKFVFGAIDYYMRSWSRPFFLVSPENLEDDYHNTKLLIGWCFNNAHWEKVVKLVELVEPYIRTKGLLDDRLSLCSIGARAAEYDFDKRSAMQFKESIGSVYKLRGLYDHALSTYSETLTFYRDIGEKDQHAKVLLQLGTVYEHQAVYTLENVDKENQKEYLKKALDHYKSALLIFRDKEDPNWIPRCEHLIGRAYRHLENYAEAAIWLRRAVSEKAQIAQTGRGLAISKHELARCLHLQNEIEEAQQLYQEAIETLSKLGAEKDLANAKWRYSQLLMDLEKVVEAKAILVEAIELYRNQGRLVKLELVKRNMIEIEQLIGGEIVITQEEEESTGDNDEKPLQGMLRQDIRLDMVKFFKLMQESFNINELKNLCFQLGVDSEQLSIENKNAMIRDLLSYVNRVGLANELLYLCQRERPDRKWL